MGELKGVTPNVNTLTGTLFISNDPTLLAALPASAQLNMQAGTLADAPTACWLQSSPAHSCAGLQLH